MRDVSSCAAVSIPRSGLGLFRRMQHLLHELEQDVSIPRSGLGLFRLECFQLFLARIKPGFNPSFGFRPIQTRANLVVVLLACVVSIPRSGLGLFRLDLVIVDYLQQMVSIPRSGLGLFRPMGSAQPCTGLRSFQSLVRV